MQTKAFDIIIMGAGIIGVITAYFLSQKYPYKKILLLDKKMAGTGATFYSIGLDVPLGQTEYKRQLSKESRSVYSKLKSEIPNLAIYSLPFFGICKKYNYDQFSNRSFEKLRIAKDEEMILLNKSYPNLIIEKDEIILTGCKSTYSKTYQVTNQILAEYCKNKNSFIYETINVKWIEAKKDYMVVHTDFGSLNVKYLINTIGPWIIDSDNLFQKNEHFRLKKIACFNIEELEDTTHPAIVYFFEKNAFILPEMGRKRHVLSITSQDWDCEPNSQTLHFTDKDKKIAKVLMSKYFNQSNHQIIGGRLFCDTYTKNQTPIVYKDVENEKIIYANGSSGSGFRLAPSVANSIINLLQIQ